eukprot:m.66229 g.66229  ORF g.66229 m.66229 type:complete len:150 (+) comp14043_c0_seq2:257-706(+)
MAQGGRAPRLGERPQDAPRQQGGHGLPQGRRLHVGQGEGVWKSKRKGFVRVSWCVMPNHLQFITSSRTDCHHYFLSSFLQEFADEMGMSFMECSAKSATNVDNAFLKLISDIKTRLELSDPKNNNKQQVKPQRPLKEGQNVAKPSGPCC